MLLHFYQPIELRSEELGRARPNGGMMYPRAGEILFFSLFLSLFLSHKDTRGGGRKP